MPIVQTPAQKRRIVNAAGMGIILLRDCQTREQSGRRAKENNGELVSFAELLKVLTEDSGAFSYVAGRSFFTRDDPSRISTVSSRPFSYHVINYGSLSLDPVDESAWDLVPYVNRAIVSHGRSGVSIVVGENPSPSDETFLDINCKASGNYEASAVVIVSMAAAQCLGKKEKYSDFIGNGVPITERERKALQKLGIRR